MAAPKKPVDIEALMKRLGRRARVASVSLHLRADGRWLARAQRDRLTGDEQQEAVARAAASAGTTSLTVDEVTAAIAQAQLAPFAEIVDVSPAIALGRLADALNLRGIR